MERMDHTERQRPHQQSPRDIRWIFFGPHGLRAGWGILLYADILVSLYFVGGFLFGSWLGPGPRGALSPIRGLLTEALLFCIVLVATIVMSRVERKPLLAYGYQGRARRLLSGLVCGFAAISALVLALFKLGYLSLQRSSLSPGSAFKDAVLWGIMFLLTGFTEESAFRGYPQFTLARGIGFWWGALLVAALFGFTHSYNSGESPLGLISAGGVGLVFCLSLWYTGSLWWAVGFHAAWDWGQSFFYGTADSGMVARGHLLTTHPIGPVLWSGGVTGPEGSVLVLPLLAFIALLMFLWWGRRTQSPFAGAAWRPIRPD
jgi:membrane protease YdiL (CAAX protease family)